MRTSRLARVGILILALLFPPTGLEAQPKGKAVRIGLLDFGAANPSSEARWKALRQRLHELGYVEGENVAFEPRWANGEADRLPALAAELVSLKVLAHRRRLAELAMSQRLPMMTPSREYAEAGALLSYGTDYPAQFGRVAVYVDKILKGARPGDLPIEQPTKFELVINLKTARALGLTIPETLLVRADKVIE